MIGPKSGLAILLASLGLFASCSGAKMPSASQASRPLLPSELTANPEAFDGKHVDVRGYVVIGPESRNIFDSKAGSVDRHGACLGLAGPNTMFSEFHRRQTQRLSGIFRRKICGANDVCLYWCGESGIELDAGSTP